MMANGQQPRRDEAEPESQRNLRFSMTISNPLPPEIPATPDERRSPAHPSARGWAKSAAVASLVLALCLGALGLSGAALYAAVKLQREAGQSPDFAAQARVYIESHPEVIVDSLNRADARQKEAEANEAATQLAARRDELFNDPAAPVGGNAATGPRPNSATLPGADGSRLLEAHVSDGGAFKVE
jgi:uncharacterized protein HemX